MGPLKIDPAKVGVQNLCVRHRVFNFCFAHRIHGTGILNLHEWLIFMVKFAGKYTSPMDPMGWELF